MCGHRETKTVSTCQVASNSLWTKVVEHTTHTHTHTHWHNKVVLVVWWQLYYISVGVAYSEKLRASFELEKFEASLYSYPHKADS